tara:strand:+ start:3647 stop:6430 length:2784 start_codon:yes stop_codon:yes gene_type:complete
VKFLSCKIAAVLSLFFLQITPAQILGDLNIAFIRVSFDSTSAPGFTGNGDFIFYESDICGKYLIDPPPHNKAYFESHIKAVDNYFKTVSFGSFGIDINKSKVLPELSNSSYRLDRPMNYYNELGKESEHEFRITALLKEAIEKAYEIDKIDFREYDLVAVIHPGLGQDFSLPFLDPTPEDIPSTFVDEDMVFRYFGEGITVGRAKISKGIIIPESQNHPLMDSSIFNALKDPCDLQYGITGTWALMIGFAAGLPPLWQVETGKSGIGVFGLMDQGSNNGRGILPSPPNPWTRIYAGWEKSKLYHLPQNISLKSGKKNEIAKIQISSDEYFLIENRNNWFRRHVGIDSARLKVWEETGSYPSYTEILVDSTGIKKDENGVFFEIENYNIGMPASGFLIWHVNEDKIARQISSYKVNADPNNRGIDLEEADGAQDIGFVSNLITDPSSGYWGDMWFLENNQYFRSNTVSSLEFSNFTYPNSKTNSDHETGILLQNFSATDTVMSFDLNSTYDVKYLVNDNKYISLQWDVDADNILDFIGTGDSLWWSKDLKNTISFHKIISDSIQLAIAQKSNPVSLSLIENIGSSYIFSWYEFDNSSNTFLLKWNYASDMFTKSELIKSIENYMIVKDDNSFYRIDKNGVEKIDAHEDFFIFSSSLNQLVTYNDSILKYLGYREEINIDLSSIALADLDLDGRVDVIASDPNGTLHAFDEQLNYKNGFPLDVQSAANIFIANLFDDKHPEILIERFDGVLLITNFEGRTLRELSLDKNPSPSFIGQYNGRISFMLGDRFLQFKDVDGDLSNIWSYKNGSADYSRNVILDTLNNMSTNATFFDKERSYAYPNPSYGQDITFRLEVGSTTSVKISIYDLAGYLINEISNHEPIFNNGNQTSTIEIPWNVNKIEPGVYFAKIDVENEKKSSKKIIKLGIIK